MDPIRQVRRICRAIRPAAAAAIIVGLAAALSPPPGFAQRAGDVKVSDRPYVRHDGGSDEGIRRCSDDRSPTGGGNRQQNEPAVAINPLNPKVIAAGANDYCGVATWGDAWMGLYISQDGGKTWVNSLNPGYPADTSAEGRASPIFGEDFAAGDPIMDWDTEGHLFYGGIAFNRTSPNESGFITPTNGHVIVSTWRHDPRSPLGLDYLRTVIVGVGTPSAFFFGRFNDKPSLKVDTWEGSPFRGNVYVAWTLFPGAGQDQILFSRSTDHGATFSKPIKISKDIANAQGSDIAVAPDGTVYVVWRQFSFLKPGVVDAIMFVKSTDGGQTFTDPAVVAVVPVPYDRRDAYDDGSFARDCGDGPFHCRSNFVFHRAAALPQAVVDRHGTVYVTWEQVASEDVDSDTYRPDGQSQVVLAVSANGGQSWTVLGPADPQPSGHQWWPNLAYDRSTDTLALIYYDSRDDAFYDPTRPPGNRDDGTSTCGVPAPSRCNVLNTFLATSPPFTAGLSWTVRKVSSVGHQPEYEMFGNRDVPFHGDYLWVDASGGVVFGVWTDNRDVVPGDDPRESLQDGFDVRQCRQQRPDGTWGPDTCPNAGGLNQNIYGAGFTLR